MAKAANDNHKVNVKVKALGEVMVDMTRIVEAVAKASDSPPTMGREAAVGNPRRLNSLEPILEGGGV
jgi:hypothetical protein